MPFKVAHTTYMEGVIPLHKELFEKANIEVVTGFWFTENELIENCQDADAVVAGALAQPWTRRVIESLPKLRFIGSLGIGYDLLDVQAATDNVVLAANVPDYCLEEVSDTGIALMLALYRKIPLAVKAAREGKWMTVAADRPVMNPIYRIQGQTLGLVGLGRLGAAMARKAKAFDMKIIAYDPYIPAEAAKNMGVELVDMDTVITKSDYISLHAPHTAENEGMIGAAQFKKMKNTAYLINTARGHLIDEPAMIAALQNGEIAGAGLDVLIQEPPDPSNPLLNMDNVILSAHSAQISEEANADMFRRPQVECVRVLNGEWPGGLLNPEVKEKYVAKYGPMK